MRTRSLWVMTVSAFVVGAVMAVLVLEVYDASGTLLDIIIQALRMKGTS